MNLLAEMRRRFAAALASLTPPETIAELVDLVRPGQDPKFGDYQANFPMPLGKRLGRPPREVAQEVIARLDVSDLCETPTIAGPGFINLRLRNDWLTARLQAAVGDERLGVETAAKPRTYVVDYSAPNVAKPMHVGHIRSTVIGAALYRVLRFLGHTAISDNHIGDWGTQFGMIIYGYKNFLDRAAYERSPVDELARLYRHVNRLVDFQVKKLDQENLKERFRRSKEELEETRRLAADGDAECKKKIPKLEENVQKARIALEEAESVINAVENDPELKTIASLHPNIAGDVLQETAKLHRRDNENLRLWREFMPPCLAAIEATYRRLNVTFDRELGESFYHDMLGPTVESLLSIGLVAESDGALCMFLDSDAPMIVRKKDGAYLYATTDLATIKYRMDTWRPDAILYVVDHRQSLHFEHLFDAARLWGYRNVELKHVRFGTVLGEDRRPFKTRSGDTVGLMGLLDEAVARALKVVSDGDDAKPDGPELSLERRQEIAETVGIGALKYADLSQNRETDYTFSYDKMLAMNGNTATYMQYAYARVRSIFRRGGVDVKALRAANPAITLDAPAEQALARQLLRFSEALDMVVVDYRPHMLTTYLFDLANSYSTFFEECSVLKADTPAQRDSRLLLCDLTARTLKQGLELLGVGVVEQM